MTRTRAIHKRVAEAGGGLNNQNKQGETVCVGDFKMSASAYGKIGMVGEVCAWRDMAAPQGVEEGMDVELYTRCPQCPTARVAKTGVGPGVRPSVCQLLSPVAAGCTLTF